MLGSCMRLLKQCFSTTSLGLWVVHSHHASESSEKVLKFGTNCTSWRRYSQLTFLKKFFNIHVSVSKKWAVRSSTQEIINVFARLTGPGKPVVNHRFGGPCHLYSRVLAAHAISTHGGRYIFQDRFHVNLKNLLQPSTKQFQMQWKRKQLKLNGFHQNL